MSTYYNTQNKRYENYEKAVVDKLKSVAEILEGAVGDKIEIVAGVRYDAAQSLTDAQQAQARTNVRAEAAGDWTITANRSGKTLRVESGALVDGVDANGWPVLRTSDILDCYLEKCNPGDRFVFYGRAYNTNNPGFAILSEPVTDPVTGTQTISVLAIYASTNTTSNARTYTAPEGAGVIYFMHKPAEGGGYNNTCSEVGLVTRVTAMETVEETVSGATPSITAEANHRYICGTVTELSITPCASGICEIIFTSGTTATVLTIPDTVAMPDWWNGPEANRKYDIMVLNGTMGAVMSWAT